MFNSILTFMYIEAVIRVLFIVDSLLHLSERILAKWMGYHIDRSRVLLDKRKYNAFLRHTRFVNSILLPSFRKVASCRKAELALIDRKITVLEKIAHSSY